jgi:hypothetical protein
MRTGECERLCSGRLLRRALLAVALLTAVAGAQTAPKSAAKKTSSHRANEMTLAALRPGKDSAERAIGLHKKPSNIAAEQDSLMVWGATCQKQTLSIDLDAEKKIQVVRTIETAWSLGECAKPTPGPWRTGRGLRVGDRAAKVAELYGNPDSRSPSTKGGQPLELWYYAFDWAGADVPQVMEVLCTREADGKPGRVVEITLAGPSL